jgi:hypothetical protein
MAYVAVRAADGSQSIGSAFHVGEGVFVTARHVVEGHEIVEVKPTHPLRRPIQEVIPEYTDEQVRGIAELSGQEPTWPIFQSSLKLSRGPFHLPGKDYVDVAVFETEGLNPHTPHVPLGSHLDDWIVRVNFVMSDVIIFGYPPIPMTTTPSLVVARGEINAVIQTHQSSKVQFVVSAMPRGGFSGGMAVSELGFVLGLITDSLTSNHAPAELGFMAVLSIESIYECLAAHKLLPQCQKKGWGDFWNTENWDFVVDRGEGILELKASVQLCDDGHIVYVALYCRDGPALQRGVAAVTETASSDAGDVTYPDDMHARISFTTYNEETVVLAQKTVEAARRAMLEMGYIAGSHYGGRPGADRSDD